MELEQQFYLNYPYNKEYDHLPYSSSRLMRNLAEKMRRDKLNMYISELSSLVPIVAMATKRMDKTSVLRLSANFLRINLSLKNNARKGGSGSRIAPEGLESNLSSTLLEALEGFMLIVTSSGKVVYVSDSVEKLLGHSQLDLMGQSLYTICHNGDHELLRHHLQPSKPFEPKEDDEDSKGGTKEFVPRSPSFFGKPEDAAGLAAGERRSFYIRIAERSMARGDPARHVTVHMIGMLRPPVNKKDPPKKGKKECPSTTTGGGDEHLLVCVARPFRNKGITELSLMEAVQDEYVTRHLPDGRIIYSDHRIAFVAGYLTEEIQGLSAFNFIHQEDLPWATVANKQMFSSVEGQGYSVYRLRSKTGTLIHLRTRGFLEFNKTTQKVETFVCINTLLTPEEGEKELEKERERITPFITFQQVTTTSSANAGTSVAAIGPAPSSVPALGQSLSPAASTQTISQTTVKIERVKKGPNCSPESGKSLSINGDVEMRLSPQISSPTLQGSPEPDGLSNNERNLPGVLRPPLSSPLSNNCEDSVVIDTETGDVLPRLNKRSLPDVDEIMMGSSPKRAITIPLFASFSPLHHSPVHGVGGKWTETTTATTIIFDQHHNNG